MPFSPIAGDRRRRGATRRRVPAARGARFDRWLDRWLDRLVDTAVIIALLVGGVALILTLLL